MLHKIIARSSPLREAELQEMHASVPSVCSGMPQARHQAAYLARLKRLSHKSRAGSTPNQFDVGSARHMAESSAGKFT